MTDHDINMRLLATARMTHIDNNRRQQRRQATAREEAEDRAFFGERAQRRAEDALRHEQQEHNLTMLALQRVIARNEAMRRTMRLLFEKWAPLDGSAATDMEAAFEKQCDAKVQEWLDTPAKQLVLERAAEHQRDRLRVVPKRQGG